MVIKLANINARFSDIIAGYLTKGYVLNTATMENSAFDACRVDLTNESEFLRVSVAYFDHHIDIANRIPGIEIVVKQKALNTLSEFEVIRRDRFYHVDWPKPGPLAERLNSAFTEDLEEACKAMEKRHRRGDAAFVMLRRPEFLKTDKAKDVAIRYIQRIAPGLRVNQEDIVIWKPNHDHKCDYEIICGNRRWRIPRGHA